MEIHTLELSSKHGFLKKKKFLIHDVSGSLVYWAEYSSIWQKKLNVYNDANQLIYHINTNAWGTKSEVIRCEDYNQYREGVLKVRMSLDSYINFDTSEYGLIRLKTNILMDKFWIYRDEEELAFITRKMDKLRFIYGMAIKDVVDPVIVVVMMLYCDTKSKS